MRMIRVALKTLFTRAELFLIRNNRSFILESDSSDGVTSGYKKNKHETNKTLGIHYKKLLDGCYLKKE